MPRTAAVAPTHRQRPRGQARQTGQCEGRGTGRSGRHPTTRPAVLMSPSLQPRTAAAGGSAGSGVKRCADAWGGSSGSSVISTGTLTAQPPVSRSHQCELAQVPIGYAEDEGNSATSETTPARGVGRCVVQLEVVVERRLVRLRKLLAMHLNVGRRTDLLLGRRDLQVLRADMDTAQRHEGQVTADEALLNGCELRFVRSTST